VIVVPADDVAEATAFVETQLTLEAGWQEQLRAGVAPLDVWGLRSKPA
jgi:hypothetical protein